MKKKILISVFCCLFLTIGSKPASANTIINIQSEISSMQTYNTDIGYKYKYINGILYKRLWSYRKNDWIDPKWIPI